jgi:hypothetical protein
MSGLFTWESLLTLAGAGAATRYVVALFKSVFDVSGKTNHVVAVIVAEVITLGAGLATGAHTPAQVGLLALNGLLVAGFAIGLNENLKGTETDTAR